MSQPIRSRQHKLSSAWWQKRTFTIIVTLLGLIAVLVAINSNIYKYETHLATGDKVLLALAPVDPRGFMQGDYMTLSYALERDVFAALPPDADNVDDAIEQTAEQLEADTLQAETNSAAIRAGEFESETAAFEATQAEADARAEAEAEQWQQTFRKFDPREGYVIVEIDDNNVGQFVRLADSQSDTLAANEMAIYYRARNGNIKLATNAFFFQEGHAEAFEASEYGLFRVNKEGEPLLTNMVDSEFTVIDPKVSNPETNNAETNSFDNETNIDN